MSEAAILALRHDWGNRSVLTIHNLSDKSHRVSFSLGQVAPHGLVDLFGHGGFTIEKDGTITIEVGSYAYRWFRIRRTTEDLPL
ncbi:alpha-glucosidase C-terminal domain-containing protein [Paramesorhizobium deserti]|uniref:alpha-glucosidase C-terminal domain-containing protein n=1 Tax=Paramesorhizobium deserti TaxID=1494590 RepID=UPI00129087F8|nr:alpha-glucosidase C-terminal domain-containing protein [Paramesorhizobium deserti]